MAEGISYTVYELYKDLTQTEVYGRTLVELAKEDERIVALTADLARSTKIGVFFDELPERAFNFGVAEQNMMAAAAGFAISGKLPYVSTFAVFASMRTAEFVRTDIAYPNLPVRIIATHAGVSFGQAGTTHHCTEDLGILRTMANMTVVVPADAIETAQFVKASVDWPGPLYCRIGRGLEPLAYLEEDYGFEIGKSVLMRDGKDLTVIACGVAVLPACEAADELAEEGISVRIINMHTIKPLDREAVVKAAEETGGIITAEEHNVIGGLGSAVAEVLAEEGLATKFKRLGIPDVYSVIGYPEELYHRYGIDYEGILKAVREMLGGKEKEGE